MTVSAVIRSCLATVTPQAFAAARAVHPGLTPYPDVGSVVDVLRGHRKPADEENLEVTRALLVGYHTIDRPLFSALLLAAFERFLHRLHNSIEWTLLEENDTTQLIVASFLSAAAYVKPHKAQDAVVLRLKQRTRQLALTAVGKERSYATTRGFRVTAEPARAGRPEDDPEDDLVDAEPWDRLEVATPFVYSRDCWLQLGAAEIATQLGDYLSSRTRRFMQLVATVPDLSLSAYVERTSESRAEHSARYRRLNRWELWSVDELRGLLHGKERAA